MNVIKDAMKRRQRQKTKEAAAKIGVGAAVGTAIGAVAGILFAPKSGKETREDIAEKVVQVFSEYHNNKMIGEAARISVIEKFSSEKCLANNLKFYNSILI